MMLENNLVESICLIYITIDAVLNFLWSVSDKVVCLALHGTDSALRQGKHSRLCQSQSTPAIESILKHFF